MNFLYIAGPYRQSGCMDRTKLLEVSNYRLMYNQAWMAHVGFVERDDEGFPEGCAEEMDVLSCFGDPLACCELAVLCSSCCQDELTSLAYVFGLELALNLVPACFASSYGNSARASRRGFMDGSGRCELFVDCGLTRLMERPGLKWLTSRILRCGGVIWSPFIPLASGGRDERLFAEYLSTRKRYIVCLGLDCGRMSLVESALHSGSEVFVHSAFLSARAARALAAEGAALVSSAADLISCLSGTVTRRVYSAKNGRFSYNGHSYGVFSHSD